MKTKIIENNKLIADFMGVYKDANEEYDFEDHLLEKIVYRYWDFTCIEADWLLFNQEWDWLMPVVGKVGRTFFNDLEGYGGFDIEYMMDNELSDHLKYANLSEVYGIVVQFIKWYNENKT